MNETVFAVLAIIAATLSAASMALHFIAPRTKTTVDDTLAAKVDELLALVRGVTPPSVAITNVAPSSPAALLAAELKAGTAKLGALTLIVLALGGACATARPRATAGLDAMLDCTAPARAAVVGDLGQALVDYARKFVSGDKQTVDLAKLKASAVALKGEVIGSCALVTALAILATPKPEAARSLLAEPAGPDPVQWRGALEAMQVELGVRAGG